MQNKTESEELLTIGEHLEILRKLLFKVLFVFLISTIVVFCFKNEVFSIILAPKSSNFISFQLITNFVRLFSPNFSFEHYNIQLISTEASSQFMNHIYVSCILGLLISSPFILYQLLKYISPALYENEKKYSSRLVFIIFFLFFLGVLISYYILFPVSFRFLATYSVDESISNMIKLDSYISTFASLTFMTGIVFQLPIISFVLGKMGILNSNILVKWRPYAIITIMIIAAIITPPDIFTLIIISIPIYGLYELSIIVLKRHSRII